MKNKINTWMLCVVAVLCLVLVFMQTSCAGAEKSILSPNRNIRAQLTASDGQLFYTVSFMGEQVIARSPLGIIIDQDTLGMNSMLGAMAEESINERYITRGFHTEAIDHCNQYTYNITSNDSQFKIQFRLYDDGVAFRYIVPKAYEGQLRTVNTELTSFQVPSNKPVWFFERPSDWKLKTYAGEWTKTLSDSLYCISPNGPVQGSILLYELGNEHYMGITEAALYNYSGMRLEAKSDLSLQANFTEKEGFKVENDITTPWRVIILADGLNSLVNTDIITNLNPAPDPKLFADTEWIKPGRSVWSWWTEHDGYMTPGYEKQFIDMAAELGYEYTTIDEGWERVWTNKWAQLKEMCDYARTKNVGIFVWKRSGTFSDPVDDYATMAHFLDSVAACGAVGLKIDFMDSESKKTIDFDIRALQLCAERHLMVNFHGCQKPSGEIRTYPNEITREGIRGLELNKMKQPIPPAHNVALVFTRGILNNSDYTPVGFSNPGNTTWAHQLATAYAFTSPLLTVAEHPSMLLNDARLANVLSFIKEIPATWDETKVLPGSSIGGTAILARRKGNDWYVVALNGDTPKSMSIPTDFLPSGNWIVSSVGDSAEPSEGFVHGSYDMPADGMPLICYLAAGGGFVAKCTLK
ncbi:glycoside hydrolase family 97 protein [Bacteroides sp. 51]|uniref:glycoside hydrolase family 97 protein n=1 Tax=Bacteroides sp. 51 TaxID=2302938 RepID=UPI0013D067A2|nr:glycoside hydrolase family 97 protein [Bacteroides sp. 51]NDV81717.1 glycoside hydrolase [Bacteroides sp. 51]